jgi:hypothetical protein
VADPADQNHLTAVFVAGDGTDLDIKVTDSYDAGVTWSLPLRVNDDPQVNDRMQDLVWADFDSDGDLCVAWRDRRNGAGPGYAQSSEIYCTCRLAEEQLFMPNFALTAGSTEHNDILEQNGNDFMSLAFQNDTIHAVWGSTTDGSLDIWYARHAIINSFPSVPMVLVNEKPLVEVTDGVGFWSLQSTSDKPLQAISLFKSNGQLIRLKALNDMSHQLYYKDLSAGLYVIQVKVGGIEQSVKVVVH